MTHAERARKHYTKWCRSIGVEPAPAEVYEKVIGSVKPKIVDYIDPRDDAAKAVENGHEREWWKGGLHTDEEQD